MNETQLHESTDGPSNLPPLFESEAVSEAELMGDESEAISAAMPAGTATDEPVTEPERQPGIDYAELELAAAQDDGADELLKEFRELSPSEYRELLDEDPDQASIYLYESRLHRERQEKRKSKQDLTSRVIGEAAQEIQRIIPDIYSDRPEQAARIAEFAIQSGIDGRVLEMLTRPDVQVTVPGKKPIILGRGAATLVKMLANLHARTTLEGRSKANTSKPRPQATQSRKTGETSLNGLVSESEFASLSAVEQERLLGK